MISVQNLAAGEYYSVCCDVKRGLVWAAQERILECHALRGLLAETAVVGYIGKVGGAYGGGVLAVNGFGRAARWSLKGKSVCRDWDLFEGDSLKSVGEVVETEGSLAILVGVTGGCYSLVDVDGGAIGPAIELCAGAAAPVLSVVGRGEFGGALVAAATLEGARLFRLERGGGVRPLCDVPVMFLSGVSALSEEVAVVAGGVRGELVVGVSVRSGEILWEFVRDGVGVSRSVVAASGKVAVVVGDGVVVLDGGGRVCCALSMECVWDVSWMGARRLLVVGMKGMFLAEIP
ncbi:hypothetical protein [Planctomycetes bacterium Pla163]